MEKKRQISNSKKNINSKVIKCEKCDYKTKDRSNLKKHVMAVHDQVKFPCSECDCQW